MKELISKTVTAMYVNEDQSMLKFDIAEESPVYYYAEGDCCSETWFADIVFNKYRDIFPFTIESVEEIKIPDFVHKMAEEDGRGRQECEQVYGYDIDGSNRTGMQIVYRNSSNGYYGGSCEFVVDEHHRYYADKIQNSTWTKITQDWRA